MQNRSLHLAVRERIILLWKLDSSYSFVQVTQYQAMFSFLTTYFVWNLNANVVERFLCTISQPSCGCLYLWWMCNLSTWMIPYTRKFSPCKKFCQCMSSMKIFPQWKVRYFQWVMCTIGEIKILDTIQSMGHYWRNLLQTKINTYTVDDF